jgi:FlaA1/EpsC-like NDP-sugar epimerase
LTYRHRFSLLILLDSLIVLTAIFFSSFLVNATLHVISFPIIIGSVVLVLSHHFFSLVYKLYKKAWEYASVGELLIILKVVTFSILITGALQIMIMQTTFLRLLVVTWMLHILLIGSSRFCWRMFRDNFIKQKENTNRTLIIGAGAAGTMVARQLIQNPDSELQPIAFIDDSLKKRNLDIMGIPVIGGINQIEQVVQEWKIDNIIIAIPSLNKKDLNTIFLECAKTKAKTKILPMLEDLVTGKVVVSHFRDVQVEDLLGREPVELNMNSISEYIKDKVVLVTGAGGSIGSEICRQIAQFHPEKLILLGHGENSIYSAEMELSDMFAHTNIKFYTEIADVQDAEKMQEIMNFHRPQVVYHAAAHKHVPLMQRNPEEAVKNNVIGTMNVAKAASLSGVGKFVMISTDKAVNPTSIMGATKRLAEMIVQHMDTVSSTNFVAVRFGNVLGSRGSVIPRCKTQIQNGGPVMVTHPDMVRYFMTIPEASRLVIQAGALARGGEIFVLDMGEPVKIVDLAKNLIKLSGYSIEEIGIEFNGMRPGEKLFEELLSDEEIHKKQVFPKIYIGKTADLFMSEIEEIIETYTSLDIETLKNKLLNVANGRIDSKVLMTAG